jgi:hypothetical protein
MSDSKNKKNNDQIKKLANDALESAVYLALFFLMYYFFGDLNYF